MNINHHGSLLTVTQPDGTEVCLGYMFNFDGKGIFSPDGKVKVTHAEMEAHNNALSEAELKGLDENCQIGQCGTFYYSPAKGVHTFIGALVSNNFRVAGKVITFIRNGKTFRGRLQKDADCFNFKRVA